MVTRRSALVGFIVGITTFIASVSAEEKKVIKIPKGLQEASVTVQATNSIGSGVMVQTSDGTTWVWTAAHVVRTLRTQENDKIKFKDATIVQFRKNRTDGRIVGNTTTDAEVIRYSNADTGYDLALLRIRDKDFKPSETVKFYLDKDLPDIGDDLYHCGSLYGTFGANSVTSGALSQHGRIIRGKIYDQVSCNALPGSSGGPVCLRSDGRYVGMLVMGIGPGFNLVVPVRVMQTWATKTGVGFAIDNGKPVPSDEELQKLPVDDMDKDAPQEDTREAGTQTGLRYWLFDVNIPVDKQRGFGLDFLPIRWEK